MMTHQLCCRTRRAWVVIMYCNTNTISIAHLVPDVLLWFTVGGGSSVKGLNVEDILNHDTIHNDALQCQGSHSWNGNVCNGA